MAARSHWVKIDRALDHIDAVDKAIQAWRHEDPYTVREEDGPYIDGRVLWDDTLMLGLDRRALVFRLRVPYPAAWSAYIGDAIHNLRSALDHLAFALNVKGYADAHNGAHLPAGDAKRSEFPIFGREDPQKDPVAAFAAACQRKLPHAAAGALRIIEDEQPYKRGNDWKVAPLWILQDLDRIDKHRQLVLASTLNERLDVNHFSVIGPVLEFVPVAGVSPLDDGDELAYWIVPSDPGTQVDYDLNFAFRIAFGEGTPCAGWPVIETLRGLRDYVRCKVALLDKFC